MIDTFPVRCYRFVILCAMLMLPSTISWSEVRLPAIFGDHMVLQSGQELPVWGWADPGEQVMVSIDGAAYSAVADGAGDWSVTVAPLTAGGPYTMICEGENRIEVTDILAGEVWLASGQSNMEMRLRHVQNAPQELAAATHWEIRLFQVTNDLSPEPQKDVDGRWEICRPATANGFSAVAYFFGRAIQDSLGVPVGLIHTSWGGTSAETWMRAEAAEYSDDYRRIAERWEMTLTENPGEIIDYFHTMALWEEDVHDAEYVGTTLDYYARAPRTEVSLGICPQMPGWVYNAMLAPLIPFSIRGVIWYQGETNAGRAYEYRTLFPALIEDWRREWGQGDFAFCFVQLANYGRLQSQPGESTWAELREAQLMTLTEPNTAMASAVDIGLADNIHPLNKQEVGRRLALAALGKVYEHDIVYSGPIYQSMTIAGDTVTLRFTHIGSGLKAGGDKPLTGFAIAGVDRQFVWADARIVGDTVVVRAEGVSEPKAVRYGWADNPDANLYNIEGLPASPFRTDDWPGTTQGR